jgi:imidazolonepropionase
MVSKSTLTKPVITQPEKSMSLVIRNADQVVCMRAGVQGESQGAHAGEVYVIADGAVLVRGEKIAWVGPTALLPAQPPDAQVIDATGRTVLPGLIDSHTHLVFAGDRAGEWEERLQGASYEAIASRGGGINATVGSVRAATKNQLSDLARPRLERMLRYGITTMEVKSGYGLSVADEIKCLEVIADLNAEGPWELVPTFMGAHEVPGEYRQARARYIDLVVDEMLPEVVRTRLALFCDVFCEKDVFSIGESEQILRRAAELGLGLKIHADELSPLGGAELAARLGAVSADHLLCISDQGIEALARAGTVASLLPGTAFFLGRDQAPARRLIERGVKVALASDCNPGTCPTENLPLVGAMACAQMKMTPAQVIKALTINAAAALDRESVLGSIEVGKQADLLIADVPRYAHLFYHFGVNHAWRVIKRGRVVRAA